MVYPLLPLMYPGERDKRCGKPEAEGRGRQNKCTQCERSWVYACHLTTQMHRQKYSHGYLPLPFIFLTLFDARQTHILVSNCLLFFPLSIVCFKFPFLSANSCWLHLFFTIDSFRIAGDRYEAALSKIQKRVKAARKKVIWLCCAVLYCVGWSDSCMNTHCIYYISLSPL